MTLRYLLDTSIVSSPVLKSPSPEVLERLAEHGHESAIAAPVWHELLYGCARLARGARRAVLEAYVHEVVGPALPVLAYDDVAASWHAKERARLEGVGKPAPYVDGQIAAIAHRHDLVLVTANTRDFTRFSGLTVENWSRKRGRGG